MALISSTLTPTLIFFLLILSLQPGITPSSAAAAAEFSGSSCLRVSPDRFVDSVGEIIGILQDVTSILSRFTRIVHDLRLSNAISDCLDLLDMAFDDLTWSVSAAHSPKGKSNGTGNLSSDLRTWLSAALSHPETCIDGFEGTHGVVKGLVSGGLGQMISLVKKLLLNVIPVSDPLSGIKGTAEFPSWLKAEDEKLLQQANGVTATPDAVVAADGSGNYTKVMDAVLAAPEYSLKRYVIYVKKGIYEEYVEIKKKKWNIMIVGDGLDVTVISGNRNYVDGRTTFRTATFAVSGRGFIARDISFQNTAGPEKHQAVALRSDSDLSVYFRCGIFGYQDSLYTHTMRQFYRECKITGTVDFIFGDATAMFQNCQIQARKGLANQKNTITAQGRKDPNQPTGFSFQNCSITADSDLLPAIGSIQTYLGRPWKTYSRTVFMQSYMSEVISPEGWLEWNTSFDSTLYYAEYANSGVGAGVAKRVTWPGYHVLDDANQASNFTVTQFIEGNLWLPSTGVIYIAGLIT